MDKKKPSSEDLHKQHVRLLWRLVYAVDLITCAKETVEHYLRDVKDEKHPFHFTFASSAIVTYSAPFIETQSGMSSLPKRYTQFADEQQKSLHKDIIAARNTIYAHIDPKRHGYIKLRVRRVRELPGHQYEYAYSHYREHIQAIAFPGFADLCSFQLQRMKQAVQEQMILVFPLDDAHHVIALNQAEGLICDVGYPE